MNHSARALLFSTLLGLTACGIQPLTHKQPAPDFSQLEQVIQSSQADRLEHYLTEYPQHRQKALGMLVNQLTQQAGQPKSDSGQSSFNNIVARLQQQSAIPQLEFLIQSGANPYLDSEVGNEPRIIDQALASNNRLLRFYFLDFQKNQQNLIGELKRADLTTIQNKIQTHDFFIEATDNSGNSLLHYTIRQRSNKRNNKQAINLFLIDNIADINLQGKHKTTLLLASIQSDKVDLAEKLLAKSADIHIENAFGWTPLIQAVKNGHAKLVEQLLASGAKVNHSEATGFTPLHFSAHVSGFGGEEKQLAISQLLISAGATIDQKNAKGDSPLKLAIEANKLALARILLEQGAQVDSTDLSGWTPLMLASYKGQQQAVALLLQYRANPLLENHQGKTAWQITEEKYQRVSENKYLDIMQMLQD